jgi:hypothetical protein
MPQLDPQAVTPTPVEQSGSSSTPPPSAGYSSPLPSWPQLISHALSTTLALVTVVKILSWFPTCLDMVRLPTGGVSHDVWAWAPLVLDLGAAVAVAAPVSFRSVLDLVRGVWRAGKVIE